MIVDATVYHKRLHPRHEFKYKLYYVRVTDPYGKSTTRYPWLFSINRWNLMSLWVSKQQLPNQKTFDALCLQHGVKTPYKLELLALPHLVGFGFKPVSFWLIYNQQEQVESVICEVHNTFGEHHFYICHEVMSEAPKQFHVSPFFKREGEYQFNFKITSTTLAITINYLVNNELQLLTSLQGEVKTLTNRRIVTYLMRYPLMGLRVIALIHKHAFYLWWKKKVSIISKPEPIQPNSTSTKPKNP